MKKIIVRRFHADWCYPCRRLDEPGGPVEQLKAYVAKKAPEDQAIFEPVDMDTPTDPLTARGVSLSLGWEGLRGADRSDRDVVVPEGAVSAH